LIKENVLKQLKLAAKGDDEATEFIDEDFLRALDTCLQHQVWG
jgi:lysyl-tRNA synthetase class 2